MPRTVKFQIYRYDPDKDAKPYMQDLTVELQDTDKMLLDALQRINALKVVLATLVNTLAACVFIVVGTIDWQVAGLIAAGSTVGGVLGARVGRRRRPLGRSRGA